MIIHLLGFTNIHLGEFKRELNSAVLKDMRSNKDNISVTVLAVDITRKESELKEVSVNLCVCCMCVFFLKQTLICLIIMMISLPDDVHHPTLPGMYSYHGNKPVDFLRITMAMPRLIAPAKRLLEQGFKFGPFSSQSYPSYEANIDFEIRCVVYGKRWIWDKTVTVYMNLQDH